jgi:hypothetical protein
MVLANPTKYAIEMVCCFQLAVFSAYQVNQNCDYMNSAFGFWVNVYVICKSWDC